MKLASMLAFTLAFFLWNCGSPDPTAEIDQLIANKQIPQAKKLFQEALEKGDNPALERKYLIFLFDQKHYRDFQRGVRDYLARFPEDSDIKNLEFDYYAKLATDAERLKQYGLALDYIVQKLLSPDYRDFRKWESRQTTVLRKWFDLAKEKNDTQLQKDVLLQMRYLGFENLAKSMDEDLYSTLPNQDTGN